jgi:two-component system sensor histidine kinase/response regulator
MNMQILLYFTSILLTCALTGFLAWYAWRQPALPGVRAYAGMALSECLLALAEILSMISGTQVQVLFWFNLRFVFTTIIPVLWLRFALEYNGGRDWLSKRLLAGLFILPLISQILLWSNSLHGLWVKQEVAFHQNGPFWIAETGARVPGLGFMVHSIYSLLLLLAGVGVILFTAWSKRRQYHAQALLLSAGALVVLVTALIPIFNLLPQTEFNPFIPGIGISALLYALAIFRFQFLKYSPAQESASRITNLDPQEKGSLAVFIFIFILLASGLAAVSYLTYQNYEKQFRAQVEEQLSAIAALKVSGLENWRAERMADAEALYNNPAFAALVQRSLENPGDAQVGEQLQTWLDTIRNSYQYDRVFLLDSGGVEWVSSPVASEPVAAHLSQEAAAIISSGQVTFLDFHRDSPSDTIHLALLVPIYAEQDRSRPLGLLVLRINPENYLYPYINQWPIASATAETLLVRRDGNDALFLNELRFQSGTALKLRIPLENTDILSVKAALGQTGVVEGGDYRGVAAIGYVGAVPGSPWFLVARMDTAEVYAPLRERLWQTILFFGMLILAAGAGLMLVWRQQRVTYYRAQVESAKALRASEEKFRLAFDTSPDSVAITRLSDGMFVSVNKGFEQITGYPREQVIGKSSLEINIWKDPQDRRNVVEGLRSTGEIRNYEASFLTRSGEIYGLMSAAIIELNGEPHILNITRDITERKRAEDALRESEDKFKYVFEYSVVGKSITQFNGGMQVNNALCNMLGYSPQEMQDKKWQEITHPDDIELTQKEIEALLSAEKESVRFVKRFIHKNGHIVWVDLSSTMRRDGQHKPLYLISAVIDITERKQVEERLIASEIRYRRLFEAARDGILILEAESGVVIDVNPFLIEMLGFPQEEIRGKELWELGFFKDIAANKANFLELQQKEYIRYEDLPLETADGRRFRVEFVSNVYQADHHKIVQCNIRDITERKRAEQQLANYTEHLEEMVDERTRELRAAHEQLVRQERLATLGQLAGSIGHELRNPLGVISNAIYYLKMAQPDANNTVKEYLEIIEKETRTSDKIVTDLLDFTRIKAADRALVVVSELVRQTLERFPAPPSVEVVLEIAADLPPVYADPQHILQVLGNLTVNACQSMPDGGELIILAYRQEQMIAIAVKDTGLGIPPENMSQLFEPLFTTKTKGIGLGLAVSKKLVEANSGRIEVQSEPGKGSTFTLYLPQYSTKAEA